MRVNRFSVAVTVEDVVAGADFYVRHFGFRTVVAEDFVAKLLHEDPGYELVLIRQGTFGEGPLATGIVLALEVDDIEAEVARLEAEGVRTTVPIQTEEWGERLCQVADPNGLTVQLVQWVGERPA